MEGWEGGETERLVGRLGRRESKVRREVSLVREEEEARRTPKEG